MRPAILLAALLGLSTVQPWGVPAHAEMVASDALRVIDGDTVRLGSERIRIEGIDTPEMNGRCAYERSRAMAARERLAALLAVGVVDVRRSGLDRFGRTLASLVVCTARTCFSIADALVFEGYAVRWGGRRHQWCE